MNHAKLHSPWTFLVEFCRFGMYLERKMLFGLVMWWRWWLYLLSGIEDPDSLCCYCCCRKCHLFLEPLAALGNQNKNLQQTLLFLGVILLIVLMYNRTFQPECLLCCYTPCLHQHSLQAKQRLIINMTRQ